MQITSLPFVAVKKGAELASDAGVIAENAAASVFGTFSELSDQPTGEHSQFLEATSGHDARQPQTSGVGLGFAVAETKFDEQQDRHSGEPPKNSGNKEASAIERPDTLIGNVLLAPSLEGFVRKGHLATGYPGAESIAFKDPSHATIKQRDHPNGKQFVIAAPKSSGGTADLENQHVARTAEVASLSTPTRGDQAKIMETPIAPKVRSRQPMRVSVEFGPDYAPKPQSVSFQQTRSGKFGGTGGVPFDSHPITNTQARSDATGPGHAQIEARSDAPSSYRHTDLQPSTAMANERPEIKRPSFQAKQNTSTVQQLPIFISAQETHVRASEHSITTDLARFDTQQIQPNRYDFQIPKVSSDTSAQSTQIFKQLVGAIGPVSDGSIDVKLWPDELGRVRLTMTPTEAGLSIQIAAERPEILDLMRRHIDLFELDLGEQGFTDLSFSFGQEDSAPDQAINPSDESDQLPQEPALTGIFISGSKGRVDLRL